MSASTKCKATEHFVHDGGVAVLGNFRQSSCARHGKKGKQPETAKPTTRPASRARATRDGDRKESTGNKRKRASDCFTVCLVPFILFSNGRFVRTSTKSGGGEVTANLIFAPAKRKAAGTEVAAQNQEESFNAFLLLL